DERGYNQIFRAEGATRVRMQRRYQWFADRAKDCSARRILEIGCGAGDAAMAIARSTGAEVVAIDISEVFLSQARAATAPVNLSFRKFDLLSDDLTTLGRFDLVFGNGILHHLVARLPAVLMALHRLTTPAGGMAFIEPNLMNPYCSFIFRTRIGRKWASLEPAEMAFRAADLRRMVEEAGWQDVELTTKDFLVPGIPMGLVKPVLTVEPILEGTSLTRWLAQSHFLTANAKSKSR
ncbi:MAG: class I SAM-dependent methyltransferase, partial [Alphaproteobacteria bacterium]|nr:class I SAM-dependent methyltransferase [Alphaproteobacteria bacterium]